MPYTEQIAATKQKLAETKQAIKALQEKKSTVTDTEELKAVNKQINALQDEFGRLKRELKDRRDYEQSVEREFIHCVVGEE